MSQQHLLNNSNLPEKIQKLIYAVVQRTRLRKAEKLDVAHELISHFQDSLEGGVEPKQAIAEYGSIKTAAKLLRASKKRQRWWVERTCIRTLKWTSVSFACLLLVYGVLVVMVLNRKPNIAIDYIEVLNEPAAAVPEADRAWPIYRAVGIALLNNPAPTIVIDDEEQVEIAPDTPNDPNGAEYAAWLETHKDTLELIRKGASMKGLGYIAEGAIAEADRELWPDQFQDGAGSDTGMVISILLPQLSHMKKMARMLRFDALVNAEKGNSQACIADVEAILLLAIHNREHQFIINDLVSLSIFHTAFKTIRETIERNPKLFSVTQLQGLQSKLLELDRHFAIRFDAERIMILDILQRIYTDDGNGDGVIVPSQLFQTMSFLETVTSVDSFMPLLSALATPFSDVVHASRKELLIEYDARLAKLEQKRSDQLYEWTDRGEIEGPVTILNKYFLLNALMPTLSRTLLQEKIELARRNGIVASLYAVEHYQTTGEWPADLSDAGVVDGWSGEPLKIAEVDGLPVIYSVGADQDDDGGVAHEDAMGWQSDPSRIPDGDWVLFSLKQ